MSNIRVDILFKSVRDLQQEKSCLEQKLRALRNKRTQLEETLEGCSAKYAQVRDINVKMSETLKVAQQKVARTQSQVSSMDDQNKEKRLRLDGLSKELEEQRTVQRQEASEFEKKLEEYTNKFNEARDYYKDDSLESEKQATSKSIAEINCQSVKLEKDAEKLKEHLSKLTMNSDAESEMEVSPLVQEATMEMFSKENEASHLSYQKLEERLEYLTSEMQKELEAEP